MSTIEWCFSGEKAENGQGLLLLLAISLMNSAYFLVIQDTYGHLNYSINEYLIDQGDHLIVIILKSSNASEKTKGLDPTIYKLFALQHSIN